MGRNSFAELCRTEKDWVSLREIFVRAFLQYPLYKYLVRDETKRAIFLKRYLKAHYEVNVRNGNSPLICIRVPKDSPSEDGEQLRTNEVNLEQRGVIVGGVLFITPSSDGNGWDNERDDVYLKAYRKFKLDEVDGEAFERLLRYEEWETKHVTSKILSLGVPLWNGVFCAMDPAYSGEGFGTLHYADCMRLMAQVHKELEMRSVSASETTQYRELPRTQKLLLKSREKFPENNETRAIKFPSNMLHGLSLLSHHPYAYPTPERGSDAKQYGNSVNDHYSKHYSAIEREKSDRAPMLVAFSHCHRAVEFHRRHGFRLVRKISYNPSDEIDSPFNVYILFSDPFDTGKLDAVASKLHEHR